MLLCQLEVPLAVVRWALETARRHEVPTILNPAPAQPLGDEILALAELSHPERGRGGRPVRPSPSRISTRRARRPSAWPRGAPAASSSPSAAVASSPSTAGTALHFPAFPITPVDTTAAGDAFNGALAVGLAAGGDLEQAVPLASAAAALACTKRGAQDSLPYRADVEAYLQSLRRP